MDDRGAAGKERGRSPTHRVPCDREGFPGATAYSPPVAGRGQPQAGLPVSSQYDGGYGEKPLWPPNRGHRRHGRLPSLQGRHSVCVHDGQRAGRLHLFLRCRPREPEDVLPADCRRSAWGQQVWKDGVLRSREVFSRPILSRIFYQSLLTERRNKPRHKRRLAGVLWKISSGDETYRRLFAETLRTRTAWLIFAGGVLVTIRNFLTERLFGLEWGDFGRYPTGVPLEEVEKNRREIMTVLGLEPFAGQPEFERMYSIRMKADEKAVFRQLGKFGDEDRKYFKPRFVNVHRTVGGPNEVGSTVRYDVLLSRLSFNVVLEKVVAGRYLLYRV